MKFCRFCGAELREGMRFCTKCGAAVQPAAPAPARVEEPIAAIPTPPPVQPAAPAPARVEEPIAAIPTPPPVQPAAPVQPQPPAPAAAAAKKPIPRWLVLLVIAAAAFAVFWFFIRKDPIQDVKDYVPLHGTVPFGVVVDSVMPGTTWSSTGGGSTYMVTMSGMYDFMPISATFQVTYSGSVPYVRFLSASVMGETVSDPEDFVPGLYAIYSYNAGTGIGW